MSWVPVLPDVATEQRIQRAGELVWIPYRSGWQAPDIAHGARLLRNLGVVGSRSAVV